MVPLSLSLGLNCPTHSQLFHTIYDSVDRLISATHTNQPGESFSYDSVGNRISSHKSSTYTYQPYNRLSQTATASYSFNSNGNPTTKSYSSGTTQYRWDNENRLTHVILASGTTVNYKYDALGRRIERSTSSGEFTRFQYDGHAVVLESDAAGATTAQYLNGLGIDEKVRQTDTSGTHYFLQDHLGSTTHLTDPYGNIVESNQYDSFGSSAGSIRTRYGFTGRENDNLTGLMYYRARWYDAEVGRFISEDPIQFDGGLNWYAYVDNGPLKFTDALGLHKKDKWYGYNNRDFRDWVHRHYKGPGKKSSGVDLSKEDMDQAYEDWKAQGSPKRDKSRRDDCDDERNPDMERRKVNPFSKWPTLEELKLQEESHRQMEMFWKKVLGGTVLGGASVVGGGAAGIYIRTVVPRTIPLLGY
jgi:RHS repeat-associated protein